MVSARYNKEVQDLPLADHYFGMISPGLITSGPVFLPAEYIGGACKRVVLYAVAIALLHLGVRRLIMRYDGINIPSSRKLGTGGVADPAKLLIERNSLQLTNMLINLFLGCVGLYYWLWVLSNDCESEEKMKGGSLSFLSMGSAASSCAAPHFFAEFQLSYQLWSLAVCSVIGDTFAMTIHHVVVAVLATFASSLVMGARYFSVYFFGVVEFSSVFLSIMNAFKSRPDLVKDMPMTFACIKLLFSTAFFGLRVILWIPMIYDFFLSAWAMAPTNSWAYYALLICSSVFGAFLTFLQFSWACKIVKGLLKMAGVGCDEDDDHKRSNVSSQMQTKLSEKDK